MLKKEVSANKLSYEERKQLDKDIRKLTNKVAKLEREVDALEQELKQLDAELANPEKFKEMSKKEGFFEEYQRKQTKIKRFYGKLGKISLLKSLKARKSAKPILI